MTMYVQFLASAVVTQSAEELPTEALRHSAAWWRQRLTSSQRQHGITAEHRLCDEVAYDRALVALAERQGITVDLTRFGDRVVERRRLEAALALAGMNVRDIAAACGPTEPEMVLEPA
jgi:hypothetical protein